MSLSAFRSSMLDCEINRNNILIATYKGLISDSKDYNLISFDYRKDIDIQVGDDIYCPLKKKHYIITNVEISTFNGKIHSIDAYFENSFNKTNQNIVFNTYNPSNSIIGNQQYATLNINESFKALDDLINDNGGTDKSALYELLETLKSELSSDIINRSKLAKFGDLIAKHSWLALAITQIFAAWIQRG